MRNLLIPARSPLTGEQQRKQRQIRERVHDDSRSHAEVLLLARSPRPGGLALRPEWQERNQTSSDSAREKTVGIPSRAIEGCVSPGSFVY